MTELTDRPRQIYKFMVDWWIVNHNLPTRSEIAVRVLMNLSHSCTGDATDLGEWHGEFKRRFLPKGEFKTNDDGNLEHIKTGRTDYDAFEISEDRGE